MDKKRTAVVALIFFLIQAIPLTGLAPAEIYSLNPPSSIDANNPNVPFQEACNIFFVALSLYESDAVKRLQKDEIIRIYAPLMAAADVRFDLEHIDLMKKGWTRYYPFSVGERKFIARIFLTKESYFQAELPVISEIVVEKIGVTLQVLPGLAEILKDRAIRPNKPYPPSPADKSV